MCSPGCYGDLKIFSKQSKCLNLFPIYHIVQNLRSSLGEGSFMMRPV